MVLKTSFAPYKLKRERRIHLLSKQWVKAAPIKFFVVKYSRTCAKCVCFVSAVPQPLVLYSAVFMFFFFYRSRKSEKLTCPIESCFIQVSEYKEYIEQPVNLCLRFYIY